MNMLVGTVDQVGTTPAVVQYHGQKGSSDMEALFYQTRDIDLPAIAQALVLEYQAKGFEAQQFGDVNNVTVQLRHESTLRAITGFNKALAILMEHVQDGTFVRVGAQDWVDQIVVGAVGLVIHPLLITAAIGALTQYNALHEVLRSIDYQVRRQQPQVQVTMPPSNLWMPPTSAGAPPTYTGMPPTNPQ